MHIAKLIKGAPSTIGSILLTALVMMLAVSAIGHYTAAAQSASDGSVQGYAAESPLDPGTVVQLVDQDKKLVKIASQAEPQNMFGVAVDRRQLSTTLSNPSLQNEVFIAVSGTYNVLVSTQGGSIKSGDYVTLSSVSGIAMKAGTEEEKVFGRAGASFDGTGIVSGSTTLKDADGNEIEQVKIGLIPVTIDIRNNPNEKSTEVNVPDALKRVGQAIAEKEVSAIRIYLSMGITTVSILAAIAILYSGVRSSMISIGRNPMSKKSIFRALLEVILTSILILVIGLFAVYLLLKL